MVCDRGGSGVREFVEVKTSRYYDHNVFDLSYFEWEFLSREPPVQYRIYRVSGAAEAAGPRVSVIHDVLRAVKQGSLVPGDLGRLKIIFFMRAGARTLCPPGQGARRALSQWMQLATSLNPSWSASNTQQGSLGT